MYYKNPIIADDVVLANPKLVGKTAMEVFDETVNSLANAGVAIILNNHISDAMWCCSNDDGNGLWHNQSYNALQWHKAVVAMSQRYNDVNLVIANDLRNEIRDDYVNNLIEEWGTHSWKEDWKMAATLCANAIMSDDHNYQLIIIEGLNYANDMSMIKDDPISLKKSHRLVYSFHLYSW